MLSRSLIAFLVMALQPLAAGQPAIAADWRDSLSAFRVGIVAEGDLDASISRAEPFRLALEEGLGIAVEIFAAKDLASLVDAAARSRIEYAVLSASALALAWDVCECVEPLVVARAADGAQDYREVLIVRNDGPSSLGALKGGRIAAVRPAVFGGFDIALAELKAAGLDVAAGEATLELAGDSEASIAALNAGSANALLGWSSTAASTGGDSAKAGRGTLARIAALEGDAGGYRILWQSGDIPHRMHAVRRNLPGEVKTKLRELLTGMFDYDPVAYDSIEPEFGGGFVAARLGQIEPLAAIVRSIRKKDAVGN